MNLNNFILVTLLLIAGGITYIFMYKPEIPQKGCDFFFTSEFESFLMGTDLLMKAAAVPRNICVSLGFAETADITYYYY